MLVSIGILTFNRRKELERAIESSLRQSYGTTEIVVVDSASNDGTEDMVLSHYPAVRYVRLPHNLGCPEGRNHVFANCRGEIVLCLDDDGYLDPDAAARVVEAFASDRRVGAVAMRQRFEGEGGSRTYAAERFARVSNFSGGVVAFRRDALAAAGGYPSDFFLFAEEGFLALRLMDAGYWIVSDPEAVMWHPRLGPSSSVSQDYYRFRNPLLIAVRLYPLRAFPKYFFGRLAKYLITSLRRGSPGQYLRAAGSVIASLPAELAHRRPVRPDTFAEYLRLFSDG